MNIGFIGAGNMGRALIQSFFLNHTKGNAKVKVWVYDPNPKVKKLLQINQVHWADSLEQVLKNTSTVFLCIKPKDVKDFFNQHRDGFHKKHILVSIIAGLTISQLKKTSGISELKVCRIMPNLAAAIGRGAGTVSYSKNITTQEKKSLGDILSYSGLYLETQESLVNAVTSISGCGPAFVFLFIEAMTQAATDLKIPRAQALRFVIETLIGSASLIKTSGEGPLELTDRVTSPGGMTIEGVNHLNYSDFHALVKEAVFRSHSKAQSLFQK